MKKKYWKRTLDELSLTELLLLHQMWATTNSGKHQVLVRDHINSMINYEDDDDV